jgi:hypothetical protein
MEVCAVDFYQSGDRSLAGSSEHGYVLSDFIKDKEFLEYLRDW